MWIKPSQRVPLDPSQLIVGLYIEMDATWTEHPFLSNRFKLTNDKQIAEIRALNMHGRLFYYPNKSDAEPPEAGSSISAARGSTVFPFPIKKLLTLERISLSIYHVRISLSVLRKL